MVGCLLNASIEALVKYGDDGNGLANVRYSYSHGTRVPISNFSLPHMDIADKSMWAPAIDGVELTDSPAALIADGKVADVPMIMGTNRDEGSTFTGNQTGFGDGERTPDSWYYHWLYSPEQFATLHGRAGSGLREGVLSDEADFLAVTAQLFRNASVAQALSQLYTPGALAPGDAAPPSAGWWWSLSGVLGDFVLSCPTRRAAQHGVAAHGRNIFVYYFSHTPNASANQPDTEQYGAFHGSEVPFVFYDTFELMDEGERALSRRMVQYWINFANTGDVNVPPAAQAQPEAVPAWPAFNASHDQYAVFGLDPPTATRAPAASPNVTIVGGLKSGRCAFWDAQPV